MARVALLTGVRRQVLACGMVLLLSTQAIAGSVQNIGLYDGANAPIVEIQYTGNGGEWVYADAQTATNWTFSNGSSIPLYCIDLQHDNYLGSSYDLTAWTNPNSFSADAINRVAWAIENTPVSAYGAAATQLLVWSIIDPNFQVINWNGNTGPGSLEAAYDALESRMLAYYNPNVSYLADVTLYDAVHEPASYLNQDLAFDPHSNDFGAQSVPEPPAAVSSAIGAIGLVVVIWLRRLRRHA